MGIRFVRPRELCLAFVVDRGSQRPCKAPTDLGCLRCGKPFCGAHLPENDQRCYSCELDFRKRAQGAARRVLGLGYAAVIGTAVSLGLAIDSGGLVLAASAAGALPATYATHATEAVCRRRFLRERGKVSEHRIVVRRLGAAGR